jgi:hypothetical protein
MPWLLLNATSVAAADKDMSPEHAACIDKSNRVTDETKIKTLTGGDKITLRFMKQDFFDFVPTFKLFICGNHKLPVAYDVQHDAITRPGFGAFLAGEAARIIR